MERHWHYIKYKALKERINRSVTDLLHVLVGEHVSGTWLGGIVLEWFKHKQEVSECERFLPRANCNDQRIRLSEAQSVLERYVVDPNTIMVLDETRLLFGVLSMKKVGIWYNVSVQCSFCDCQNYPSKCKHLMGIRLIISVSYANSKKCIKWVRL